MVLAIALLPIIFYVVFLKYVCVLYGFFAFHAFHALLADVFLGFLCFIAVSALKGAVSYRFSQGLLTLMCNNSKLKADINFFFFLLRRQTS